MLKNLAKKILAPEIANDTANFQKLRVALQERDAKINELVGLLNTKSIPSTIISLDDLNPTEDESALFQELGLNKVYQSMMEKMVTRAFYLASKDAAGPTKDKMLELKGFRDGCLQIPAQVINETQKEEAEKANPLTGELHTPKKR